MTRKKVAWPTQQPSALELEFATRLAYLGPMWEETLSSDTYAPGPGSAARVSLGGMAGVANIGADRNWTGSHFAGNRDSKSLTCRE